MKALMFDHEKLKVYQDSIKFVAFADELLETIPKNIAAHNQLERASTSISLNIAEGNGKHTSADRCSYFDNAKGSSLECAAALDILLAKKKVTEEQASRGKKILIEIYSMLFVLIRANSESRNH